MNLTEGSIIGLFDVSLLPKWKQRKEYVSDNANLWELILGEVGEHDLQKTDYLVREDKISTLVREKVRKEFVYDAQKEFFSLFSFRAIQSRLSNTSKLFDYLVEEVAKKMVTPMLQEVAESIKKGEIRDLNEMLETVFGEVKPNVSMNVDAYEDTLLKAIFKGNEVVALVLEFDGTPVILVLDRRLPKRFRTSSWSLRGRSKECRFMDAIGVAESALCVKLDQLFHQRIEGMKLDERMQDVVYRTIYENTLDRSLRVKDPAGVLVAKSIHERYPGILAFMKDHGLPSAVLPSGVGSTNGLPVIDEERVDLFAPFIRTIPRSKYFRYLENRHPRYLDSYLQMFLLLSGEWRVFEQSIRYQKELGRNARVFETKRNIPEKYVDAMKQSKFNDFFRYVEIDGECDLSAMREIEKEFIALKENCFDPGKYDADIRFRKLGRHHAAGLYFPHIHCLCVDIREPSSMGHEYLHMYDYFHGLVSMSFDFSKIRSEYERLLREQISKLDNTNQIRSQLMGSTKYNLTYYLEPTEIFARCGEIYFTRILGVNNSLLKPSESFAYPKSDGLEDMIKEYYSGLFLERRSSDEERRRAEEGKERIPIDTAV